MIIGNDLHNSVQYLKGVGPQRAKYFTRLGIKTIEDLLYYFPRRYEDRTHFTPINQLQEEQVYTLKARILAQGERQAFRRINFKITEVVVGDETGRISCVWFNQRYLKEYLKIGEQLILYGKVERYGSQLQIVSPEFEVVSGEEEESLNLGRITPVYALPEGITQRAFRQRVKLALDTYVSKLVDFLPYDIRQRQGLLNLAQSLVNIHFPETLAMQKQAYERLAFDEFFIFQLPLALRKSQKKERKGIVHIVDGRLTQGFLDALPFTLTKSQEKVIAEIRQDMASTYPMQRLLQGDVGSGKTVVATVTSLMAIQGGYQVAFMVPTEILARQHYEKIRSQVSGLRAQEKQIQIEILTSGASKREKDVLYRKIKQGDIDLVIGTHALLEQAVEFKNLGLVVIDEQHKFGVGQRALLPRKGLHPDVLIMTATPIPRTLAITLYGDLDISIINEMPPGRPPVKTLYFKESERAEAYRITKEELLQGRQAYLIYPVIEESFALDIAGAKQMYARLKAGEFKEFRVGLIHGRLKEQEQERIISQFSNHGLDLLIATTVLEVGIDIPSASVMMIERAERFGLAQLHQLRGRVGRGAAESQCLLISNARTPEAQARLNAMVRYTDGFRIAEEDLKIRGPGEFFGRRQHGLTELKVANPLSQMQLLKKAREEAIKVIAQDPRLQHRQNIQMREKLLQRFPGYEQFTMMG